MRHDSGERRTSSHASYVDSWNEIVAGVLDGGPVVPDRLRRWFSSYQGTGRGTVSTDAFPEPWVGPFDPATCRGVMLGLNPGRAHLDFQSRTGVFAEEIRRLGTYSAWAATWPFTRDPWVAAKKRVPFHTSRFRFLRQWTAQPTLSESAMVTVEMYPWHSTGLTAAMRPDPGIIREWVLRPVRALDAPVFAFGAPWLELLPRLGLTEVDRLGFGGRPYDTAVPSRTVAVYDLDGEPLIAEKHTGGAGPPRADEVEPLRAALGLV